MENWSGILRSGLEYVTSAPGEVSKFSSPYIPDFFRRNAPQGGNAQDGKTQPQDVKTQPRIRGQTPSSRLLGQNSRLDKPQSNDDITRL